MLALVLVAAVALAACGSDSSSSSSSEQSSSSAGGDGSSEAGKGTTSIVPPPKGQKVGSCTPSECDVIEDVDMAALEGEKIAFLLAIANEGTNRWAAPFRTCIEENGGELQEVNINADLTKVPGTMQGWIDSGVSAIVDIGAPLETANAVVKQANSSEVPVIVYGAGRTRGTTSVEGEAFENGRLEGEYFVEQLPEGGTILSITNSTVPTFVERAEGLKYVMDQNPQFDLVEKTAQEYSVKGAEKVTEAFLLSEPYLAAAYGGYGEWTVGALKAIEKAGSDAFVASAGDGNTSEFVEMRKPDSQYRRTIADGIEASARLTCEIAAAQIGGVKVPGENFNVESKPLEIKDVPSTEFDESSRSVFAVSWDELDGK